MSRPRVYVSGPISNGGTLTAEARENNMKDAIVFGTTLIELGYAPLIPHLGVIIEKTYGAIDQETWLETELPWLRVTDAMLRIPGQSAGADKEAAFAEANGIPVYHSIEELKDGIHCPSA